MSRKAARFLRDGAGASAVEFAMLAGPLFMVLLSILQLLF